MYFLDRLRRNIQCLRSLGFYSDKILVIWDTLRDFNEQMYAQRIWNYIYNQTHRMCAQYVLRLLGKVLKSSVSASLTCVNFVLSFLFLLLA